MSKPIFRINLEKTLNSGSPIVLELGCGTKKIPGRIGIDHLDMPQVDIVADLEEGLPFFPDNCVDAVYSDSLLEHINNLDILMRDVWRILKPGVKKYLFVPHFSNPYHYSDYTHKRFFGLYSFEYFSKSQSRFKRKVPNFYNDYNFTTEKIALFFDSPWKSRKIIKRALGILFNLSTWLQEFYEENLCFLMPCYGIKATLIPQKNHNHLNNHSVNSETD